MQFRSTALPYLIFALLCGSGIFVANLMETGAVELPVLLVWLPYILVVLGVTLSAVFHHSALIYPFCILAGGYYFAQITAPAGPDETALGQVGFAALALLLPLNLLASSFLRPAAMISPASIARYAFLAIQVAFVITLTSSPQWLEIANHLHGRALSEHYDHWTWLTQPALGAVFVSTLIALVRSLMTGKPLHVGICSAIILASIALHFAATGSVVTMFFSASVLILMIALVQDTYRMAFLDELANMAGRRAMMHLFSVLGARYTVAMCDIDHFKKFNDTYGHDVGDQVLKMVAGVLDRVGGGGKAFRYSGEEFTIVFAGRDSAHALPYLEKLRGDVEAASFALRDADRPKMRPENPEKGKKQKMVAVTISIGIADKSNQEGKTGKPDNSGNSHKPMDILKLADKALYRAKKAGRNCVSE
mgnify:CR=1 FL=1